MTYLLAIAIAYGTVVAVVFLIQRSLMYHPGSDPGQPAEVGLADMQVIAVETEDGLRLLAWYKPSQSGNRTVVMFHGNAGDIGNRGHKARPILDAGLGLLLAEYRGFGGNPGKPDEAGLLADGRAYLAFLAAKGISSDQIVLYGESLGTGVAVALAHERSVLGDPVAGVFLEAPYTSIASVAQKHYFYLPAYWLVRDRFDSISRVARIGAPLVVVHGDRDRVIPQSEGRRLFAAAHEPKQALWVSGATHNNLHEYGLLDSLIALARRAH